MVASSKFDINDSYPHVQIGISRNFKEVQGIGCKKGILPENYVNVKRQWKN